jgi:hypothetical protein
MMLTGTLYNVMGYVRNVGVSVERVHNCDLRAFEMSLFGFQSGGARITPSDWFLTHHADALDLYCALPYGIFLFAGLGFAFFLYYKDHAAVQRYAWVFFTMNMLAFATYHVFPAAPPWYYHQHGCAISMTALPSAGPRLLHVDDLLGIHYFRGTYERSSDLYGAVPSLHVAYPLLILLEGWAVLGTFGRGVCMIFVASMAFAAVYLDHHWIVDLVLGVAYCVGAVAFVRYVARKLATTTAAP